jgi:hypothetical protein
MISFQWTEVNGYFTGLREGINVSLRSGANPAGTLTDTLSGNSLILLTPNPRVHVTKQEVTG